MLKRLLIMLAIILAAVGLWARYQNAGEAARQMAVINQADTAGQDTGARVQDLKAYVKTHMGALANFTLVHAYERAQATAQASAAAQAANSQIYADAQRTCGGKSDSVTQARCNQDYISKHLANVPLPTPVPPPNAADYQYKLSAPLWTPDLAGSLLLGAGVAFIMGVWGWWRRRKA